MECYEFNTEEEACDLVEFLNGKMSLPNKVTKQAAIPFEHNGKWYIAADVEYNQYIDLTPITIEITNGEI
jgi:hypothetical protein